MDNVIEIRRDIRVALRIAAMRLRGQMQYRSSFLMQIAGNFIVDTAKLQQIGWRPAIATHDGIVRMMRAENGAAV